MINQTVTPDDFGLTATDDSEIKIGFRKAELIKTEEELEAPSRAACYSVNNKYTWVQIFY